MVGSLAFMGIRPCVQSVLFVPDENDRSYFRTIGNEFMWNSETYKWVKATNCATSKKALRHCRISLRDRRSGAQTLVGEIFSVHVHIGPEADPASCTKGVLDPFPGVKGLGRSIDYLSTFSAYVRNRWSSTSVSFLYLQWHVTGDVYIAGVLRRTFRQEVVGSWIKLFNLLKTKRRLLFKDPGRTAQ